MLQISYSEVFLAICLSWMMTINRAYVYKKIPKYTIDHDMTLLQVIISRHNIQKKSILIWCYGTEDNFHLSKDFERPKLACQESKIGGIFNIDFRTFICSCSTVFVFC